MCETCMRLPMGQHAAINFLNWYGRELLSVCLPMYIYISLVHGAQSEASFDADRYKQKEPGKSNYRE